MCKHVCISHQLKDVGEKKCFKPPRKRITLFPLNTYLHYILCSLLYLFVLCSFLFLANVHNCNTYTIYSQTQGWWWWGGVKYDLEAEGVGWRVIGWLQHDTKLAAFLLPFHNQTNPHLSTEHFLQIFLWFPFISSHQRHDYFSITLMCCI